MNSEILDNPNRDTEYREVKPTFFNDDDNEMEIVLNKK